MTLKNVMVLSIRWRGNNVRYSRERTEKIREEREMNKGSIRKGKDPYSNNVKLSIRLIHVTVVYVVI